MVDCCLYVPFRWDGQSSLISIRSFIHIVFVFWRGLIAIPSWLLCRICFVVLKADDVEVSACDRQSSFGSAIRPRRPTSSHYRRRNCNRSCALRPKAQYIVATVLKQQQVAGSHVSDKKHRPSVHLQLVACEVSCGVIEATDPPSWSRCFCGNFVVKEKNNRGK